MIFRNGLDEQENAIMEQEVAIEFDPDEDRAVQGDALEANINTIIARFKSSGVAPAMAGQPVFGDFFAGFDLQDAMQKTHEARESFAALPADLRERFNNDPARLLAFLENDENRAEGEKLGLLTPRPAEPILEPPAPVSQNEDTGQTDRQT